MRTPISGDEQAQSEPERIQAVGEGLMQDTFRAQGGELMVVVVMGELVAPCPPPHL